MGDLLFVVFVFFFGYGQSERLGYLVLESEKIWRLSLLQYLPKPANTTPPRLTGHTNRLSPQTPAPQGCRVQSYMTHRVATVDLLVMKYAKKWHRTWQTNEKVLNVLGEGLNSKE